MFSSGSRWTCTGVEGSGLVLNPSAICLFKVAVQYSTVNNTAHKQDITRLLSRVRLFRTSPSDAGCLPPFQSSRNAYLQRQLETFLLLSHPGLLQWAPDKVQQKQWQCSPRSLTCTGDNGARTALLNWPLKKRLWLRIWQNALVTN